MWPFKSNDTPEDEEWSSKAIPITTLARWYIYDMVAKDVNKLATALALTPVSEEGDEKESQDSIDRLARVESLIPYMEVMSDINSKVIMQLQRDTLPEEVKEQLADSEEALEHLLTFYDYVSFAAILSAFSSAAELGIIDVSGRFTHKETGEEQ